MVAVIMALRPFPEAPSAVKQVAKIKTPPTGLLDLRGWPGKGGYRCLLFQPTQSQTASTHQTHIPLAQAEYHQRTTTQCGYRGPRLRRLPHATRIRRIGTRKIGTQSLLPLHTGPNAHLHLHYILPLQYVSFRVDIQAQWKSRPCNLKYIKTILHNFNSISNNGQSTSIDKKLSNNYVAKLRCGKTDRESALSSFSAWASSSRQ